MSLETRERLRGHFYATAVGCVIGPGILFLVLLLLPITGPFILESAAFLLLWVRLLIASLFG